MNYRHAFHAGNFADVVKHAVLAQLIERLKEKDAAFRVIDTHAGAGAYGLAEGPAERTNEWQLGIGKLWGRKLPAPLRTALAPYLDVVAGLNPGDGLLRYPGSPVIVRRLLRRQDRLTAVEMHPEDAASLAAAFAGDVQVRVVELDGWLALGSFVPPKERRGLVLVDPPFESTDEFAKLADGFLRAHRRWPTGTYALWYPVKNLDAIQELRETLAASGIKRLTRAELTIRRRDYKEGSKTSFNGAGLILANAPWKFSAILKPLLSGLVPFLAQGPGAGHQIDEISGE
jgi:23S rRNA (adenine2030-N6)-methyltransferase